MANIIYTACAAITLVIVLMLVLERSLSRDFSKLEILKTSRR
jgi:transmembrane 9 superfamily member 2/4